MMNYIAAALCLLAVAEAGVISPAKVSRTINPLAVEGIIPCEAVGQTREVRVPGCSRVPCALETGNTYNVEIDFVPSATHARGLHLKVIVINEGISYEIIDGDVPGSEVEAGGLYTLVYPVTVEGFFLGESDLRIEVSGVANPVVELCGIAGIIVS